MTKHHRVNTGAVADTAFGKIVGVGAANTDCGDAHLYLAGFGIGGRRGVDQPEGVALVEFGKQHRPLSLLLLEEVIERGAGVCGAAWHRWRWRGGSIGCRRGVAGDSYARFEKLAFIGLILASDAHLDRFEALKSSGWLEMGALLAAMKRSAALGAVAFPIDIFR